MIVERLEVPSAESILGTPVLLATIASVIVASVAVIDNKASLVLASLLLVAAILGIVALHLGFSAYRPPSRYFQATVPVSASWRTPSR